jgi:hypothetical protein
MYTAKIIKANKVQNHIIADVEFIDGDTKVSEAIKTHSKSDLDNQIRRRLEIFNELENELPKIEVGDWVAPVEVIPAVKEPTAEELKAQEIANMEMEIQALVEKIKREEEINLLATKNTELATKITELETLKTDTVIKEISTT